jgi:hypothetical protein
LSHPKHAGKGPTVCQHTKKYVMFTPDEHSSDVICTLPKSLVAYHPDRQHMINSSGNNDKHDPGQMEHEHQQYNQLDETNTFIVADGFGSFPRTFQYLGLLIFYNLHDDDDITARIAAANASMGALKEIWRNPHLDV